MVIYEKKSKIIAMLLILITLVSGFTGCLSYKEVKQAGIDDGTLVGIILGGGMLLLVGSWYLLVLNGASVYVPVDTEEKIASLDQEENPPISEVSASLPETEHSVLKKDSDALRKAEFASFLNVLQHFEADYSPVDNSLYIGIRLRY